MFMTSLEVEANNKGLKGLELQLKLEEVERMKAEHQKEVQALEEERNGLVVHFPPPQYSYYVTKTK